MPDHLKEKAFSKIRGRLSEVAQPKMPDEQHFKNDIHPVEIINHPVAFEHQFTGEIYGRDDSARIADRRKGEDAYVNEEALQELSKTTLRNYISAGREDQPSNPNIDPKRYDKRARGRKVAFKKIANKLADERRVALRKEYGIKEETDLQELSRKTVQSYATVARDRSINDEDEYDNLAIKKRLSKSFPEKSKQYSGEMYKISSGLAKRAHGRDLAHKKLMGTAKVKPTNEDGHAYAIGMSKAMDSENDRPPLRKKTINKAHKIAKAILKNEDTDLQVNVLEEAKSPNPHHDELLKHGYEFKRKCPKLGQTGRTWHYVHKDTGHKAHVENTHKDHYSLYSNDNKGRQALVKNAETAASLGKKFQKEDTDLQELSKKTLGSYINKAAFDSAIKSRESGSHEAKGEFRKSDAAVDHSMKRLKGIKKATKKMAEETIFENWQEVERLKSTGKYRDAGALAHKIGRDDSYGQHFGMKSSRAYAIKEFQAGHAEAAAKAMKKENLGEATVTIGDIAGAVQSNLSELSNKTLVSYIKKARKDNNSRLADPKGDMVKHFDRERNIYKARTKMSESFTPGQTLKLQDGKTTKLSSEHAKNLNKLYGSLSDPSKKEMMKELTKDTKSFQALVGFASSIK